MEIIRLAVLGCTLGADELAERARDLAAVNNWALRDRHHDAACSVLRYRAESSVEDELRRLIGLEGQCCTFLSFDLATQETGIVLSIAGAGSEDFMSGFQPEARPRN